MKYRKSQIAWIILFFKFDAAAQHTSEGRLI
jgi:hypothetical protein